MAEILLIVTVPTLIILVAMFFIWQRVNEGNSEHIRNELIHLLRSNEEDLKEGFAESRKELREMSSENRKEIYEVFKNLQDTLLNRITENSNAQNNRLDVFKMELMGLSEKLLNHSNDFKQTVTTSFQLSNEALNRKQDE
jgi:DNA recombination protein RmuC